MWNILWNAQIFLPPGKQSEEKWLASAADALKDWALRRLRLLEVVLQEDPAPWAFGFSADVLQVLDSRGKGFVKKKRVFTVITEIRRASQGFVVCRSCWVFVVKLFEECKIMSRVLSPIIPLNMVDIKFSWT